MDRRHFLKQVSVWSAGLALAPPVFQLTPKSYAGLNASSDIFVAKGKTYSALVDQVIENMGGISAFVKSGDKVVIKPNIGWDRTVDQAANTHPVIVARLAELCLDAGASKIRIFDRTCNEKRRCYASSGIKKAVKAVKSRRVKLEYIDKRKFVPVTIKEASVLGQWSFYKDALEADAYINVPVAKHHGLSRLSLGLKNIMGVIGGSRGRIHSNIGEKLADLNRVIQPAMTLVDATRVIVRNGPNAGDLADVKTLHTFIGSTDPVAADAYATTLFGLTPDEIDSTVSAHRAGLGQMDLDKCRIHLAEL